MKNVSILIVGQGLAGSLLAWQLWQRNIDFLLIDSPHQHKSSEIAAGLFNPLMFRKLKLAGKSEDYWPSMFSTYTKIEAMYGVNFFNPTKSLKILSEDEYLEWMTSSADKLKEYISKITRQQSIKGLNKTAGLGYFSGGGYLDVVVFLQTIKSILLKKNQLLSDNLDYRQLKIENHKVHISNIITTNRVVFCEGAGVKSNPWFKDAGIVPNKGEFIEIEAPDLEEKFIIRDKIFILPLGNHKFRVGATYCHHFKNILPTQEAIGELKAKFEGIINASYKVLSHKAGLRPAALDRKPVLGAHPNHPELVIFNGMGSKGVAQAPYWSNVLANWLLNPATKIPSEVDVIRYLKQ
ncbi:NAD(P)/FAD-dependent oxidoreductase [Geofilum sp. OHC36d9]|uniref:NAD(P)/FAD-dependent oxidoreductase n=1 Tax=Geofilum sp. OHC36d9 TaxID=3458413 RepID=UPI004034A469